MLMQKPYNAREETIYPVIRYGRVKERGGEMI